jgi:hypothetical protein
MLIILEGLYVNFPFPLALSTISLGGNRSLPVAVACPRSLPAAVACPPICPGGALSTDFLSRPLTPEGGGAACWYDYKNTLILLYYF